MMFITAVSITEDELSTFQLLYTSDCERVRGSFHSFGLEGDESPLHRCVACGAVGLDIVCTTGRDRCPVFSD